MPSDNTGSKERPMMKAIYRFLGGSVLGGFILTIPIIYGAAIDFGLVQVSVASILVIGCGLLSIAGGEKFIDTVMRMLNNTGL